MKALITDELLHNDDPNVQIAVASCCNELTRITAPEFPYEDDTMRVIFHLFMIAFEQLSCESGRNYYRALHIVETIAKVRSSMMLLDIDTDELVVDMFQLFLINIGSNHPSDVFKHMEMIMTLVIEESEEISFELLRPLLASVKMKNKDISPVSWELGKKVFENCETKLQCYLREAVKALNLEFGDYAEIVARICHGTSDDNMAPKKDSSAAAGGASRTDGLSKAVLENCSPQTDDDKRALQNRRRRKPSSGIRPEQYDTLKTGDKYSHDGSPGSNEEKEDLALTSELGNSSMFSNSSRKKIDFFSEVSLSKNGLPKKKMNTLKLKERGYDAIKKTGKRAIVGSSKLRMEKEGGVIGDKSKEQKHQLSPQEPSGRKEIISHTYVGKDAAQEMEEFPMSKHAKANLEKEKKKSRRLRIDHGEGLVDLRIRVWWPMDEVFYAGTVKAFDPETKKHTIVYDDNEIEILNLSKEKWKPLGDVQPRQKQEADHSFPSRELINRTTEKNTKRKAGTLKKQQQHAVSSSKRLKGENRSLSKSEHNASPGFHQVIAESDAETCETNVSVKDDGQNHTRKEESEILIKKTESDNIQQI
ncbi:hypothetical protein C2S52_001230 [Perilla frutescens var. hirtella]|nr:hypothetical protein C2S51_007255 [Perilla frutescens var. frutescens]KAH6800766.1 hypothetical protein C2S52_001230 [Perilla frutescens var. hirtella]